MATPAPETAQEPRLTLRERIEEGAPFRLGELARYMRYSRDHLRKLCDAGVIRTTTPHRRGVHRRVTVSEAERFAKEYGIT